MGQLQSVSSLRFFLYDRSVHPELFDIHQDRYVVKTGYEAQIWVTGCAHVIGVFSEGGAMVEVTAEAGAELPRRGLVMEMPVRGEREYECRQNPGLVYMTSLQVETMSPMVYSKTHHELTRAAARRGLFVPFPTWMTPEGLTPFTYIDYDAKPAHLHVFAYHAFPEDLTVVKTQSIFEAK